MHAITHSSAASFLDAVEPLLLARAARHNLILGVATTARDAGIYEELRAWHVELDGVARASALHTPPFRIVAGDAEPLSIPALVEAVLKTSSVTASGVVGNEPTVGDLVDCWTTSTGVDAHVAVHQGVYELTEVVGRRRPPGALRLASPDDTPLLVAWFEAFGDEAPLDAGAPPAGVQVAARLASPGAGVALWEVMGEPVALAGFGGRTVAGVRIGPVYTPPDARGAGYATALVAELSDGLLADGAPACFLYTDLANPTSNAIYQRIGYRRVCDSLAVDFTDRR